MRKTPLENWISQRIHGLSGSELTGEDIRRYQLEKLKTVIDYALEKSPFYREHLRGYSSDTLQDISDLSTFPTTTPADLQNNASRFLCVSQSEVERVVTLQFPNSAEAARRLYFTRNDLERTIDFFHHGMTTLVHPGMNVLILMPGDRPGTVGDLLAEALRRAGVQGFVHGIVQDPIKTIRCIIEKEIDCLVGIPTQVLSLAEHQKADEIPAGRIKSILLSADYVPSSLVEKLHRIWRCSVFGHYGTTEMGFGGGVECEAFAGYHLREADLLFEIVDPISGRSLPDGRFGEIVFTTPARSAMPLIRYRTGDLSRFLPQPCPCGTVLRRLEKVTGKLHDAVFFRSGDRLSIRDLDEILFTFPGIVNYRACFTKTDDVDRLELLIHPGSRENQLQPEEIRDAVAGMPSITRAMGAGLLVLEPIRFSEEDWITTGTVKRSIVQKFGGDDDRQG